MVPGSLLLDRLWPRSLTKPAPMWPESWYPIGIERWYVFCVASAEKGSTAEADMRRGSTLMIAGALVTAVTAACVGQIGPPGPGEGAGQGPGGSSPTAAACSSKAPGHVAIHRLTNDEYDNTIHDLLYTTATPGKAFDPNPAGLSGF
jgi:hypothetical protein